MQESSKRPEQSESRQNNTKSSVLYWVITAIVILAIIFAALMAASEGFAAPAAQATPTAGDMSGMSGDMTKLQSLTGKDFEIEWLNEMIVHHQGAVDMANLAHTNAKNLALKDDMYRIISKDQTQQIGEMTGWLQQWYGLAPNSGAMGNTPMPDTNSLKDLTGDSFDKAFLTAMTTHHQGAIAMAKLVSTRAVRPELKSLAEDIINTQSVEIDKFNGWLQFWYGTPTGSTGNSQGQNIPATGASALPGLLEITALIAAVLVAGGIGARIYSRA